MIAIVIMCILVVIKKIATVTRVAMKVKTMKVIMPKKTKIPKTIESSALTKNGYGLIKLNELGYPVNDPYGLSAAFCNEKAPFTVFKFLRRT